MKISRYFIYIIWLTLFGCSPTYTLQLHEDKVIVIQAENDSTIMAIIYFSCNIRFMDYPNNGYAINIFIFMVFIQFQK